MPGSIPQGSFPQTLPAKQRWPDQSGPSHPFQHDLEIQRASAAVSPREAGRGSSTSRTLSHGRAAPQSLCLHSPSGSGEAPPATQTLLSRGHDPARSAGRKHRLTRAVATEGAPRKRRLQGTNWPAAGPRLQEPGPRPCARPRGSAGRALPRRHSSERREPREGLGARGRRSGERQAAAAPQRSERPAAPSPPAPRAQGRSAGKRSCCGAASGSWGPARRGRAAATPPPRATTTTHSSLYWGSSVSDGTSSPPEGRLRREEPVAGGSAAQGRGRPPAAALPGLGAPSPRRARAAALQTGGQRRRARRRWRRRERPARARREGGAERGCSPGALPGQVSLGSPREGRGGGGGGGGGRPGGAG